MQNLNAGTSGLRPKRNHLIFFAPFWLSFLRKKIPTELPFLSLLESNSYTMVYSNIKNTKSSFVQSQACYIKCPIPLSLNHTKNTISQYYTCYKNHFLIINACTPLQLLSLLSLSLGHVLQTCLVIFVSTHWYSETLQSHYWFYTLCKSIG